MINSKTFDCEQSYERYDSMEIGRYDMERNDMSKNQIKSNILFVTIIIVKLLKYNEFF